MSGIRRSWALLIHVNPLRFYVVLALTSLLLMSDTSAECGWLSYLGHHVAVVSYKPLTRPLLVHAVVYPDRHIPGENCTIESDCQLGG
jgi:hypothetical protein